MRIFQRTLERTRAASVTAASQSDDHAASNGEANYDFCKPDSSTSSESGTSGEPSSESSSSDSGVSEPPPKVTTRSSEPSSKTFSSDSSCYSVESQPVANPPAWAPRSSRSSSSSEESKQEASPAAPLEVHSAPSDTNSSRKRKRTSQSSSTGTVSPESDAATSEAIATLAAM